jgi:hypothetical protein
MIQKYYKSKNFCNSSDDIAMSSMIAFLSIKNERSLFKLISIKALKLSWAIRDLNLFLTNLTIENTRSHDTCHVYKELSKHIYKLNINFYTATGSLQVYL